MRRFAGKVITSVFWDSGVIHVELFARGTRTISATCSASYMYAPHIIIIIIIIIVFLKGWACFLFLNPQDEGSPSISSSVVLCSFVLLVYIVVLFLILILTNLMH